MSREEWLREISELMRALSLGLQRILLNMLPEMM